MESSDVTVKNRHSVLPKPPPEPIRPREVETFDAGSIFSGELPSGTLNAQNGLRVPFELKRASRDQVILQVESSDFQVGQSLKGTVMLMGAAVSLSIEIDKTVKYGSKNPGCYLFAKIRSHSKSYPRRLGQHLFENGVQRSIAELERQGLSVDKASSAIDFQICRLGDKDYQQTLKLRQKTYAKAGKISFDACPSETRDDYDEHSILLVGKHRQRVVASIRIILNDRLQKMEYEHHVSTPESFPERNQFVSFSKACVDPDYRGSDVLKKLFERAVSLTVQQKKSHVVACTTPELWPMYQRLGFKKTGCEYLHPYKKNETVLLIVQNLTDVLDGRAVNPLVWNYIVYDIIQYTSKYFGFHLRFGPRLWVYRVLRPLALYCVEQKTRKSTSRRIQRLCTERA